MEERDRDRPVRRGHPEGPWGVDEAHVQRPGRHDLGAEHARYHAEADDAETLHGAGPITWQQELGALPRRAEALAVRPLSSDIRN